MKKYIPALLIVFSFFFSIYIAVSLYLYNEKNKDIIDTKTAKVKDLQSQYDLAIASHIKLAKALYSLVVQNPEVLELLSSVQNASNAQKDILRKQLYTMLQPQYKKLKTELGIKQFHFHLKNNDSFLRMHRPQKFGDNLTDIRESVRLTNKNKVFTQGFEEGKIFNGFRYVFPIFYKDEHLGSVELSIAFTTLKQLLSSVSSAHYDFILKNDVISSKVFKDEQNNYTQTRYYKGYMRETSDNPYENTSSEKRAILEKVETNIEKEFLSHAKNERSFTINNFCTTLQKNCMATFLSIKNLKQEHVAYLVSISQDNTIARIEDEFTFQLIILSLSFFAFPFMGYMLFIIKKGKESQIKASTDFLTNALNRFGCQKKMDELIALFNESKTPISIIMFDIDHFKMINDTYGHDVGDSVLKELVTLVQTNIRDNDSICRWGGEEFLVLLPNVTYLNAQKIASKLLEVVRNHKFSHIDKLTISIGYTTLHKEDTKDSFIKRVDGSLYESKRGGRDRATGRN